MAERLTRLRQGNVVEELFEIALGRKPDAAEAKICELQLESQRRAFQANSASEHAEQKALASLCQVLLSSNEFIYRD